MSQSAKTICLEFEDNAVMKMICGQHNSHLARIESALDVSMDNFGNQLKITGKAGDVDLAHNTFTALYKQLTAETYSQEASTHLIDDMLRQAENGHDLQPDMIDKTIFATTWKRKIFPRTIGQSAYVKLLQDNDVVFGLGPAGTGKTYMAVAWAVHCLKNRQIERIILSRPAVEAGERLGFLPGDMKEKVDPYLRPLYDALYDMMPSEKVDKLLASGQIEIAPLAFMRGRTLSNAVVIIDEAQNTTPVQMKMVLTRLGEGSHMIVTGDLTQIDLQTGQLSGLLDAVNRLDKVKNIGIIHLSGDDVVRHSAVVRILKAYEKNK